MNNMLNKVTVVIILFGYILTTRATPREYPCYRLAQEPSLDGKIEEKEWANIPAGAGFFILSQTNYDTSRQAWFKVGWNNEFLYIAIRAEEPEPEKLLAKLKDGGPLWAEDSIEIFLCPKNIRKDGFHFAVNTIGSRWMNMASSDYGWYAAAYVGKDFYSLEIKIPFRVLKTTPSREARWAVNIARNSICSSEKYTSWSPLKKSFHEVANFGYFIFKEDALSPAEVKSLEKKINFASMRFFEDKINKTSKVLPQYEEIIDKGIKETKFRKEALALAQACKEILGASREKAPDIKRLCSAFVKCFNISEKTEALKNKILLESLLFEE